jgi:hypothetical protein
VWGLQWFTNDVAANGFFPQYLQARRRRTRPRAGFSSANRNRAAYAGVQTGADGSAVHIANRGRLGYARPKAWAVHHEAGGWLGRDLLVVPFRGPAIIPAIQLERGDEGKTAGIRAETPTWPTDRDYMAPPTRGKLVSFDPALIVTPPKGLEAGYVPMVTRQAAAIR